MERVWDPVSILDTILDRFRWILKGFWMDFGRILEGFREDFWKDLAEQDLTLQAMIRATKGISMEKY